MNRSRRPTGPLLALALVIAAPALAQEPAPHPSTARRPPPDAAWTADAALVQVRAVSDTTLGAGQGIAVRDGKVYAYGDVWSAKPRVGVIREYDLDLKPTGRSVWLRRDGTPLIVHPTGLTWQAQFGTFLGDTVNKKAVIYRLDWDKAWADGNLDRAVLDTIEDDAAVNGCRPTFVTVGRRPLLATADYGDIRPEIRLCDPSALLANRRTSAPGVIVARVLSDPWNQNLHWDDSAGHLTCVQNVVEGRGWRLETIDLARALSDGRVSGPSARVRSLTLPPHDELEGYWPLDASRSLLISSSQKDNIVVGILKPTAPHPSPPGTRTLD